LAVEAVAVAVGMTVMALADLLVVPEDSMLVHQLSTRSLSLQRSLLEAGEAPAQ
jgi:hypothetical protein